MRLNRNSTSDGYSMYEGVRQLALACTATAALISADTRSAIAQELNKGRTVQFTKWPSQPDLKNHPSPEQVQEALEMCRQSCVTIDIRNERNQPVGSLHGYVLALDPNRVTPKANGKRYIVTCKHGEEMIRGRMVPVLSNLQDARVTRPIDYPGSDLLILECDSNGMENIAGMPTAKTSFNMSQPAIIYQSSTHRTGVAQDGTIVEREKKNDERLILTHFSSDIQRSDNQRFSRQISFTTAGGLRVGGSGSPVLKWENGNAVVIGHQSEHILEPATSKGLGQDTGEAKLDFHHVLVTQVENALRQDGIYR